MSSSTRRTLGKFVSAPLHVPQIRRQRYLASHHRLLAGVQDAHAVLLLRHDVYRPGVARHANHDHFLDTRPANPEGSDALQVYLEGVATKSTSLGRIPPDLQLVQRWRRVKSRAKSRVRRLRYGRRR